MHIAYANLLHYIGKASWTINGSQRHLQGTKPASDKLSNCSYSSRKRINPRRLNHCSRFYFVNNTNDLGLIVSRDFWVKKITGGQITLMREFRKNSLVLNKCFHCFTIERCSKSRNCGHYEWCISCSVDTVYVKKERKKVIKSFKQKQSN